MISIRDKLKEHVEDKCKDCNEKNCEGIRINTNGKAVCEVYR